MGKGGHGVSGHTHTQAQLDHYANQNNPNNDAYWDISIIMQTNAIQIMMSIGIAGKIRIRNFCILLLKLSRRVSPAALSNLWLLVRNKIPKIAKRAVAMPRSRRRTEKFFLNFWATLTQGKKCLF